MLTKLRVNKQTGSSARRILRVRYRDHQTVRGANLRDDQAYHRAMHRRHLLTAHDWGIVTGLALVASGDDAVVVQPGVAVDLYGRLIVLAEPVAIHQADLKGFEGPVQIGIRYSEQTISASRIQETGVVFAATTVLEPKREADYLLLDPPPIAAPPLYLGTIILGGESALIQPDNQGAARRYTRFYAGSIINPDERVRVTLDTEAENDSRRFSVATVDSATGALHDRLMINRLGNAYLMGNSEVASPTPDTPLTLTLYGLTLRLQPNVPPASASPWRMYTATGTEGEGDDQRFFNELRIELFHPGTVGDPQDYRMEIYNYPGGSKGGITLKDAQQQRKPVLTIVADGTVIVYGQIDANQILQAPIEADPTDPRFLALLNIVQFNEGLEIGIVGAKGDTLNVDQGAIPEITIKNHSIGAINPVTIYVDVRTAQGNPLRGSPFKLKDTTLEAKETKRISVVEIPTDTARVLLVTVVAYGSTADKDVMVGYKMVQVTVNASE